MFNEIFSNAELHIGHEEGHGDWSRPSVGHLNHPVHPVHCSVAPDTNLLIGNLDLSLSNVLSRRVITPSSDVVLVSIYYFIIG